MEQRGCIPLAGVGGSDPVIRHASNGSSWWLMNGMERWWEERSANPPSDVRLSGKRHRPDPDSRDWSTLDLRSFKCCSSDPWSTLVRRETDGELWRDPGRLSWMINPPASMLERREWIAPASVSPSLPLSSCWRPRWWWSLSFSIMWSWLPEPFKTRSDADVECITERSDASEEHVVVAIISDAALPIMLENDGSRVRRKISFSVFSQWRRVMLFRESISIASSLRSASVATFLFEVDESRSDDVLFRWSETSSSSSSSSCEAGDKVSSTLLSPYSRFFDGDPKSWKNIDFEDYTLL